MARRAQGFTLVEVLIALVIVATALTLGYGAISGSARRLARVEEATLTRWAIDNVLAYLALRAERLEDGTHDFVEPLLGREFLVRAEVLREKLPPVMSVALVVEDAATPGVVLARAQREFLYARP